MDSMGSTSTTWIFAIILILIIVYWIAKGNTEHFGCDQTLMPLGSPQCGLRGDVLQTCGINKLYMSKNRNIELTQGGGVKWEANYPPANYKQRGCSKTSCPTDTDAFDKCDTCWTCKSPQRRMTMPDYWPH